jgi:hypothetical protein
MWERHNVFLSCIGMIDFCFWVLWVLDSIPNSRFTTKGAYVSTYAGVLVVCVPTSEDPTNQRHGMEKWSVVGWLSHTQLSCENNNNNWKHILWILKISRWKYWVGSWAHHQHTKLYTLCTQLHLKKSLWRFHKILLSLLTFL